MEHVSDPRSVLAEVSRVLKPDGVVILQVPNIDSWQFKAFGARWYGLDIPRHVIDYSQASMLRLLHECDFEPRRSPPQARHTRGRPGNVVASSGIFVTGVLRISLRDSGVRRRPRCHAHD